jgi:hypothetical protein
MTDNIFIDKAVKPSPTQQATSLGPRSKALDELKRHVGSSVVEEWKYYGKTLGWTLKLLLGNRNLCFVVACKGYFRIPFVLGDKAVQAARQSRLPLELVQRLVNAKRHAEGRGIRLEIKSHRALEHAMILLDIKQGR